MMMARGMSHVDTGSAVGRTNKATATALCRGPLTPAPGVQPLDRRIGDRRPWTEDEEILVFLRAARLGVPCHGKTRKSRLSIVGDRYR